MPSSRNPDRKIDVWVVKQHQAADAGRKRAERFAGQDFKPKPHNGPYVPDLLSRPRKG